MFPVLKPPVQSLFMSCGLGFRFLIAEYDEMLYFLFPFGCFVPDRTSALFLAAEWLQLFLIAHLLI